MILGQELPSEGTIWVSPGARIGYMDQQLENLDPKASVVEEVLSSFENQSLN